MASSAGSHVRWLRGRDDLSPVVRRCLGCDVESAMPPVVEAADSVERGRYRRFLRCGACGTFLLDPLDMPDYGGTLTGRLAPETYLEVGAGVDFIAMLLSAGPPSKRETARLVDVGCGCGFGVHYWRSLGREGLGVEPSALGAAGEEQLGVPIVRGFAGTAPELEGQRFDVVLSSEVIEHVPEPLELLRILASLRAPGGLVILSTPDASLLDETDADDAEAWEVLFPGAHTCVLTEEALRGLCITAGLPSVRMERSGAHLVCIAGEDVGEARLNRVQSRREYGEYLLREVEKGARQPSVRDGLAFRLLQFHMSAGEWAKAREICARLQGSLRERYGQDVTIPDVCRRRAEAISGPAEIGRLVPWFLLELHHALGILELGGGGSADRAREHFDLVVELAPRLADLDPSYLPTATSYACNALYQRAGMALSRGSVEEMEAFLNLEGKRDLGGLPLAPGRSILAIAGADLLSSFVLARKWDAARETEPRVIRLLQRALRLTSLDSAALAAGVRGEPEASIESAGVLHAVVRSLSALGTLRLEADRDPAAALSNLHGALDLLSALRMLPSSAAWADAFEPGVRRERERALASRPGEPPAPVGAAGEEPAIWRRLAGFVRRRFGPRLR